MNYYWMSFCDPARPEGSKFLGALIVRADDESEAVRRSWMLDLNPGGEIELFAIPDQFHERIPADWVESRLITKQECDAFERQFGN
jgi:hypothetical protein